MAFSVGDHFFNFGNTDTQKLISIEVCTVKLFCTLKYMYIFISKFLFVLYETYFFGYPSQTHTKDVQYMYM